MTNDFSDRAGTAYELHWPEIEEETRAPVRGFQVIDRWTAFPPVRFVVEALAPPSHALAHDLCDCLRTQPECRTTIGETAMLRIFFADIPLESFAAQSPATPTDVA
jgi:hypothetical protein